VDIVVLLDWVDSAKSLPDFAEAVHFRQVSEITRVEHPPERPLAIFDGDCGFCRLWIARWRARTGPKVDYAPSQEVAARFPEISRERFAEAFQLVLPDGDALGGAEAVAALAGREPGKGFWLALYRGVPGAAPLAELGYRLVARHRPAAMKLTRLLWGSSVLKPTYAAASALFLRLLGLSYLAAFVSLWTQVDGLIGSNGVLPVAPFLEWVKSQVGASGYRLVPTLSWISPGDAFLHFQCAAGTVVSLLLIAGLVPAWSAAAAWLLYLSLSVAGQTFLEFQWDILLTETGLLSVFLAAPSRVRVRSGLSSPRLARFLLVWLLFRLMLSSGAVKLGSGDPTWHALTALRVYYETQPIPPWTAWFMHQLPPSFQTASCLFLFFVELLVPFLFFAPRRLRLFAAGMTILLQALIAVTGNYAFFNLLTIALAVLLLDDGVFPRRWRAAAAAASSVGGRWPRWVLGPVAVVWLAASSVPFALSLGLRGAIPGPLVAVYRLVAPLRSANGYGLFAVMTTERPEILLEGSEDGETWKPYEFRWKPGDPLRRPRFVAPHQPRLDWQMWFAALGDYRANPWLLSTMARLQEGSPEVLGLLETNPFPGRPPRYVRAVLYRYNFTNAEERRRTGAWWKRELRGLYAPVFGGG
jgi:predicted DCC family thiol-disulfide oxidoreductase YuxK